jgi:hypothetical protein
MRQGNRKGKVGDTCHQEAKVVSKGGSSKGL